MLRIIQNTSAAGAKSYYSTADYYLDGQELAGVWRGKGAERLGLTGRIDKADWEKLCDQLHPTTGESLFQRRNDYRTVGYDFNFHVPKSVSLLYANTKDERIEAAFRAAVDSTMREIESEAQTRVRKGGLSEDRRTGNLIWGEFVHLTSRPVDGVPDPHLHAHCFVVNATYDSEESAWKAGQFRELKRDAPYFEAMFHARFARKLQELGLPIERSEKGWELGELTPELLKKFSRRTIEIEAKAKELGIESAEAKGELGAKTRSRKAASLGIGELQTLWRERMTPAERDLLAALEQKLGGEALPSDPEAAGRAVEYAISHEFERASVIPARTLLTTAIKRSVGETTPEAVVAAFDKAELIRAEKDHRQFVTTPQVLAEEREIVKFAIAGKGACDPLAPGPHTFQQEWLNASQQSAVNFLLSSRDRVLTIRGVAGVGKTTLMKEAVTAIEAGETKVFAFAPSANASRGVQRAEGFLQADTVARLLVDEKLQESAKHSVLWIDEAGLLGTRTMRDVFRLAERIDARVLLTGDRKQHGSVERGSTLRLLEEEAGLVPATVKEIQRQRGAYKEVVKLLSEGDVVTGFEGLDRLGWVEEVPDADRYQKLASDYVAALKAGETALVVAPTHREGAKVTGAVRELLQADGRLDADEREFATLVNAQFTAAEKSDIGAYRPGDVVQFFQNAKGHTKGDRLVVGAGELQLELSHRYAVFHPAKTKVAVGDVLRITHNGLTADGKHALDNGALYAVKGFDDHGNIVLANGWTIGKEFGHFTHGYAVTSHNSQGRTVDKVFIAEGPDSLPAASREQFYVSVSRARKKAVVYTADKQELRSAIERSEERPSATDLAAWRRERVRRLEREADRTPEPRREKELAYER